MTAEFVDTNILLYAYTSDEPVKHQSAMELMKRLALDGNGAISTQVLMEFYSVAVRKANLSHEAALRTLEDLEPWSLHRPSHGDIVRAARLQKKQRISFSNAMVVNSALESRARILWTEDLNHGQRFGELTVRNPFKP